MTALDVNNAEPLINERENLCQWTDGDECCVAIVEDDERYCDAHREDQ